MPFFRHHGRRLIDPMQGQLAGDPGEVSPTDLLQARFGVVGFNDAAGASSDMVRWCTGTPRPAAGRLVHGAGGVGKMRLMIEVAATLRGQGWTAGFLDRPNDAAQATLDQRWQALSQLIDHGTDQGLLIVVDDASGRPDEVCRLAERLCTLFGLLAATGLRISEALNLQSDDVTRDGLLVRNTKFGKSRLLPLHATTQERLESYLARRRRETGACPFSALRATPGSWLRRRRIWPITTCRLCRCASGCSQYPSACAISSKVMRPRKASACVSLATAAVLSADKAGVRLH